MPELYQIVAILATNPQAGSGPLVRGTQVRRCTGPQVGGCWRSVEVYPPGAAPAVIALPTPGGGQGDSTGDDADATGTIVIHMIESVPEGV